MHLIDSGKSDEPVPSKSILIDDDEEEDDEDSFVEDFHHETTENDQPAPLSSGESSEIDPEMRSTQQQLLRESGAKILEFFKKFRSTKEVASHFSLLEKTYSSINLLSEEEIGKTAGGKSIMAYKLGKGGSGKSILALGLEHAAEWPSTMSLCYFATRMMQLYQINQEATTLMDSITFYIVPIMNPDGMSYSMGSKKNRFYQLNRQKSKRHTGFDLGMDYSAFSQKETTALRNWMNRKVSEDYQKFAGMVSVQCCGESVIVPALHDCVAPEAKEDVLSVGQSIVATMKDGNKAAKHKLMRQSGKALRSKSKSRFRGKSDPSPVFAVNWAANDLNIKYSFLLEARGNKVKKGSKPEAALDLPVEEIIPVSREITKGLLKLGLSVHEDGNALLTGCEKIEDENEDEPSDNMMESQNAYDDEEEEEDENDLLQQPGSIKPTSNTVSQDDDEEEEDQDNDQQNDYSETESGDESSESDEEGTIENVESNSYDEIDEDNSNQEIAEAEEEEDDANSEDSEEEDDNDSFQLTDDEEDSEENDESLVDDDEEPASTEEFALEEPEDDDSFVTPVSSAGKILYFAYNHDMLIEILRESGISSARKVGVASLAGYSVDYTYHSRKTWSSGIADCFKHRAGTTYGVLYEIDVAELPMLKQHNLDFSSSRSDPVLRWKKSRMSTMNVDVKKSDGSTQKCITFGVREKVQGGPVIQRYKRFSPSRQYKRCLIKASERHHFPEAYIQRLQKIPSMLSDKPGSRKFRNKAIGDICD